MKLFILHDNNNPRIVSFSVNNPLKRELAILEKGIGHFKKGNWPF